MFMPVFNTCRVLSFLLVVGCFLIASGSICRAELRSCAARVDGPPDDCTPDHLVDLSDFLYFYTQFAYAVYADSRETAGVLNEAIETLTREPSEANLKSARLAWKESRKYYMQSEVFRFYHPLMEKLDDRVNAWPLDEGFIDYVTGSSCLEKAENPFCAANIIARKKLVLRGREIDISHITPELISETLHGIGEVETNIASGYHAIEFLLWGQDPGGSVAGQRPATDFDLKNCTGGYCDRRNAYLRAVSALLYKDIGEMAAAWEQYRETFDKRPIPPGELKGEISHQIYLGRSEIPAMRAVGALITLLRRELINDRMKLALMLHDPEEEQDCFSDNTHASLYYSVLGIQNVYLGRYDAWEGRSARGMDVLGIRRDGNIGLSHVLKARVPKMDSKIRSALEAAVNAMQAIVDRAVYVEHYDLMIAEGNKEGNDLVQAGIDHLTALVDLLEEAIKFLPTAIEKDEVS